MSAVTRPHANDAPAARVWVTRVALRDFRNLERLDLELPADGFALIGDNGQGKTNLLEAIYYLQLLRSMRGARSWRSTRRSTRGARSWRSARRSTRWGRS